MNDSRVRMIAVCVAVFMGVQVCAADEIVASSSSAAISPGLPADELELLDLGIDPSSFLFSANTEYNFNGIETLNIVSGMGPNINLEVHNTLVTFGDSGNVVSISNSSSPSAAPEPATVWLCLFAVTFLLVRGHLNRKTAVQAIGATLPLPHAVAVQYNQRFSEPAD